MAQKKRQSLSFAPHCRELTEALIRNLDHAKPLSELLTDEGAKANVIPQDPVIDVDALATAASLEISLVV